MRPDEKPDLGRVRDAWNDGAESWEDFVESGKDYYRAEVHGPALLAACGEVRGLDVLDPGCGQGYFSREPARRGARVTGVDLSENQIANACRHEAREPLGLEYRVMDAAAVADHWPPGRFDLVTACMSLQDMPDVPAVLAAAYQVLKPRGRLVFSVPHPLTDTPYREWERDAAGNKLALKVDRYFDSGPTVTRWNMARLQYHWEAPTWRRTLAEWSALIEETGFLIRRLHEARPTAEQVRRNPALEDCYRLPYFLVVDSQSAPIIR